MTGTSSAFHITQVEEIKRIVGEALYEREVIGPDGSPVSGGDAMPRDARAQVDLCRDYGVSPGDDITTALQIAISAAVSAKRSCDITTSIPGDYYISGPQQSGTALGYAYSGQVVFPGVGPYTSAIGIRLKGPSHTAIGGSARPPGGTRWISNASSGAIIDCIPAFTAYGATYGWSNIWLEIEDLIIAAPANPQCSGIRAQPLSSFSTRNVAITTLNHESAKTGSGVAIELPQDLNEFAITIDRTIILGWPNAFRSWEHETYRDVRVTWCNVAFLTGKGGGHYSLFAHVSVENTQVVFKCVDPNNAVATPHKVIGDLSTEGPNVPMTAFIDTTSGGVIAGRLDLEIAGVKGGLPNSRHLGYSGVLELRNILAPRGVGGTLSDHPFDNFQRAIASSDTPGLMWPSLHPWAIDAGFISITGTAGSPQTLKSTRSAGLRSTIVTATLDGMRGGKNRYVAIRVKVGTTAQPIKVHAGIVLGGANDKHNIAVVCVGGTVKLVKGAGMTSDTDIVSASAGIITAGTTYEIGISLTLNNVGVPTSAAAFVDGVLVCESTISGALSASLVPGTVYPGLSDGISLWDPTTEITEFKVRGI